MKANKLLFITALFVSIHVQSQVTIGSGEPPHDSAILDMKTESKDKGFLGPRVELISRNDNTPVVNPATGLLVLNTVDSPASIVDEYKVRANKFYYWSGTEWIEFVDQVQLNNTINNELEKIGIPRIAFFKLNGKDVIAGSGSTAKYGIKDFMKGIIIGGSRDVPLLEVANHTEGAVTLSTRVVSGLTQYLIILKPGIYSILFSYEFDPLAVSTLLPDCNNSSYFIDFPVGSDVTGDRARIHSNSYHNKESLSTHAGSISYVVKINNQTTWPVKLGTGQAGDCTENINNKLYSLGGFAISNNGTFLSVMKVGDVN